MQVKKKYINFFIISFIAVAIFFSLNIYFNKLEKDETKRKEPIIINLLTSVHPDLPWSFKAADSKIIVKPGEVKTIEYIVENLGNTETTGMATFAYFPNEFKSYIRKLNCFCYDAQSLKSKQKDKYSLVILIDPEVTKDSKTKNVKEITIQFTFFNYKKNES
jgi:cytochrome c oxidase assembly protein subunit 11